MAKRIVKVSNWQIVNYMDYYFLLGSIKGHPNMPDGPYRSSMLEYVDFKKGIAKTHNREVKLIGGYKFKKIKE